ncbi:Phosphate transport system permease protein PstC [Posidoniimonas corsicana]|uniref:Phosphate transport system permease protein n=1 Tax=Posidoniimonas corsicana TaxID=1938618 RepID=A0A5C5UUW6_9BACT|nr:phosphate ABC transporter permease subunit PstC [Posidoniimonas corsicana]TWT29579.1 Phosphate transport system permease protein PstC [Posidoniimonas corsicana]
MSSPAITNEPAREASLHSGGAARTRALYEGVIQWVLWVCAGVSVLTTLGIVLVLMVESLQFFREVSLVEFLTSTQWSPTFRDKHYGILPLFCGTLLVTGGAILIAAPIGLGTAIYLSEYASPGVRETVKPLLEVLAGIPSVVYGVVAVTTISPIIKTWFGAQSIYNAASASIVVGFMILPMIVSLSEDVLRSVPRALREAAFALGATKFDVTVKVIVPAALSGIVASVLLAVSRAIGETMAVTLAAGAQPNLTLNPLESVQTMTAYIVQISSGDAPSGSPEYKAIFAVGMTLFITTMTLNVLAQWIIRRMREQYE